MGVQFLFEYVDHIVALACGLETESLRWFFYSSSLHVIDYPLRLEKELKD